VTYCFDLDGTICTQEEDYALARPYPAILERLRILQEAGHRILLYTARGSGTGRDWQDVTRRQLEDWGVSYDGLYMGKPAADIYVDDRAMSPAKFMMVMHGER
jgi:phosphoglycolate phosphatase-like HAD superfamily hydrolase